MYIYKMWIYDPISKNLHPKRADLSVFIACTLENYICERLRIVVLRYPRSRGHWSATLHLHRVAQPLAPELPWEISACIIICPSQCIRRAGGYMKPALRKPPTRPLPETISSARISKRICPVHAQASHTTSASSLFTQTNWNTSSDLAYKLSIELVHLLYVKLLGKTVRFNEGAIVATLSLSYNRMWIFENFAKSFGSFLIYAIAIEILSATWSFNLRKFRCISGSMRIVFSVKRESPRSRYNTLYPVVVKCSRQICNRN